LQETPKQIERRSESHFKEDFDDGMLISNKKF